MTTVRVSCQLVASGQVQQQDKFDEGDDDE